MKRLLLSIAFCTFGFVALAQTQLSETQGQEVIVQLTQTAVSMQTMQCRFIQEKTSPMLTEPLVSEGAMVYVTPDKMRWEYSKPDAFTLVVNGERIVKETNGKVELMEGRSNRMYQGIVSFVMGCATGKKLFDTSDFDIALYDDDSSWQAVLLPKRRGMKRFFTQMVFYFDKKSNVISGVEFSNSADDITLIRFKDVKINECIDECMFDVY